MCKCKDEAVKQRHELTIDPLCKALKNIRYGFHGVPQGQELEEEMPEIVSVYFDEEAGVTVVLWEDDTKTIVRTTVGDTFDKERGLLQAYFEKSFNETKTQANKYLKSLIVNADTKKTNKAKKEEKKKEKKLSEAILDEGYSDKLALQELTETDLKALDLLLVRMRRVEDLH